MPLRNVIEPSWDGRDGFEEPTAQELWSRLPTPLRVIATEEILAGNVVDAIQLDLDTNVVLLAFKQAPQGPVPNTPDITVHTRYAYGNYCYDGTMCTYELGTRAAFLAFDDPTYDYEAEAGLKNAP